MSDWTIEAFAERMVRNEVLCCVSSLVATLANGAFADHGPSYMHTGGTAGRELDALAEQAFELASPVLDYESAAVEAGWSEENDGADGGQHVFRDKTDGQTWCADSWEALCAEFDIEPHESEVYEHWAVSTWFAEKLAEKGEKVNTDFAGLNVWARQCSGQAIAADAVVLKIARECVEA